MRHCHKAENGRSDTFCLPVVRRITPSHSALTGTRQQRIALRGGSQVASCGSAPRVLHGSAEVVPAKPGRGSTEVIFTCQPGLQMIGAARLRCDSDGKWTPAPPFCTHVIVCRSLRCKMQQSGAVTVSLALGRHNPNLNYDKGMAHRCSWDSACICVCWKQVHQHLRLYRLL